MFDSRLFDRSRWKGLPRKVQQRVARAFLTYAASLRTKRLIVFLTPGFELRSGGVMSIANLHRETAALSSVHQAKVVLCTIPGDPFFYRYSWFPNRNHILNLESLLKLCGDLDYLQLHIPEYTVDRVVDWLAHDAQPLLRKVRELHLNVLLQNIDLVQGQNVKGLERFGKVTATTGHEAYSNAATRAALGISLHKLGTCNGPELYTFSGYEQREPLMIVSADAHPMRDAVLQEITTKLPELKIQVIENLAYQDYEKLTRRARWSLTFGEGLDGYFVDPAFSGGVSFAVYNESYFTPAFAQLESIYPSWETLLAKLPDDIKRLDEPTAYARCWRQTYDVLCSLYSTDRFRNNLKTFYRGEYTFP